MDTAAGSFSEAEYAGPEGFREDLYLYNADSPWTGADIGVATTLHVTQGKYEIETHEQEEYGIDEDAIFSAQRHASISNTYEGTSLSQIVVITGQDLRTTPWVPNDSEAFISRSCQQGTDIDAGSPLVGYPIDSIPSMVPPALTHASEPISLSYRHQLKVSLDLARLALREESPIIPLPTTPHDISPSQIPLSHTTDMVTSATPSPHSVLVKLTVRS
ncbi:hypothetical protein QCA50_016058 [Cerrena zonata]|uniref:Uncharacterized protein n=1 Tax=Cerrena zonata TaxID=2478898 RepID=A0AAW0FP37_9APHY